VYYDQETASIKEGAIYVSFSVPIKIEVKFKPVERRKKLQGQECGISSKKERKKN
jgi:hypothetical protein